MAPWRFSRAISGFGRRQTEQVQSGGVITHQRFSANPEAPRPRAICWVWGEVSPSSPGGTSVGGKSVMMSSGMDCPHLGFVPPVFLLLLLSSACWLADFVRHDPADASRVVQQSYLNNRTKTIALCLCKQYGSVMLRNHRALISEWCARVGIPEGDGLGRHRYAREDELLMPGPHGERALPAIPPDGAVLLLSFI